MDNTIMIGCLNCQNNKKNRQNKKEVGSILAKHVKNFQYDILGTQELTQPLFIQLQSSLSHYHMYGEYRFKRFSFLQHLPIIKSYNENNSILTKDFVIEKSKTFYLPWFPKTTQDWLSKKPFLPRIVTVIICKNQKVGTICIINTHLNHQIANIQISQLQRLKNIVQEYQKRYPVILMGDFNMQSSFQPFQTFIKEMEGVGLKRVEINRATHNQSKSAIDHIFLPRTWKIVKCGLICDIDPAIEQITDHKGIYVYVTRI